MKKILSTLLAVSMTFALSAVPSVFAESVITLEAQKSKDDINLKWAQLKPSFNGDLYEEEAFVYGYEKDSFKAGKVAEGAKKDGVNMINFARYLADIPSDVYLDKDYNTYAQYGAALLLCEGKLNHTPKQPAVMPDDFYQKGYKGTSEGNIYTKTLVLNPNQIISDSILGYLADNGSGNIDSVGHRRWVLNPKMEATGLGAASDSWAGRGYSVMYAFNTGRAGGKYDCVTWPAVGYHPTNMFGDAYPWSISLNRSVFDEKMTKDIQVSMHIDLKTGAYKDITLTSADKDKSGNYFNVSTAKYGSGFCVIFAPEWKYHSGDKVDVTISGVYKKGEDTPTTIKYSVEFFKLDTSVKAPAAVEKPKTTAKPEVTEKPKATAKPKATEKPKATAKPKATKKPSKTKFRDVAADAYYADAVTWAVDKGITTGVSNTEFAPDDTCNRAQILTFLHRAVDAPEMEGGSPFTDIWDGGDYYYYNSALWAYYKGMVTDMEFAADTPCTRASTVMYLWQNAGSPAADINTDFTDVPSDAYYAEAVAWAVQNGITSGTSETEFSPDDICSRGQIVTFLHRALK